MTKRNQSLRIDDMLTSRGILDVIRGMISTPPFSSKPGTGIRSGILWMGNHSGFAKWQLSFSVKPGGIGDP
jgi:hypothetical protein